jgi:hypothetical protein
MTVNRTKQKDKWNDYAKKKQWKKYKGVEIKKIE